MVEGVETVCKPFLACALGVLLLSIPVEVVNQEQHEKQFFTLGEPLTLEALNNVEKCY